jgi:hypothetical protein
MLLVVVETAAMQDVQLVVAQLAVSAMRHQLQLVDRPPAIRTENYSTRLRSCWLKADSLGSKLTHKDSVTWRFCLPLSALLSIT